MLCSHFMRHIIVHVTGWVENTCKKKISAVVQIFVDSVHRRNFWCHPVLTRFADDWPQLNCCFVCIYCVLIWRLCSWSLVVINCAWNGADSLLEIICSVLCIFVVTRAVSDFTSSCFVGLMDFCHINWFVNPPLVLLTGMALDHFSSLVSMSLYTIDHTV